MLLPAGFGRWAAFSFCLPEAGACGSCFSVESRRARYLVCLPDVSLLLRRLREDGFSEAPSRRSSRRRETAHMPCRFFRVVLGRGVLGAFLCGVWPRVVPGLEGGAGVFFDSGRVLFEPEVSAIFLPGASPFSFCADDLQKHFPTDGRWPLFAFLVSCGGAAVSFSCGCPAAYDSRAGGTWRIFPSPCGGR